SVPQASNVKITVYNALGQQVAELANEMMNSGIYEVDWNASALSSGVYVYRLEAGNVNITRKMSLLK
ncbi:MAG: T9SS C-terminal target domain-containing protein, partial [Chlorobiota bacterium]